MNTLLMKHLASSLTILFFFVNQLKAEIRVDKKHSSTLILTNQDAVILSDIVNSQNHTIYLSQIGYFMKIFTEKKDDYGNTYSEETGFVACSTRNQVCYIRGKRLTIDGCAFVDNEFNQCEKINMHEAGTLEKAKWDAIDFNNWEESVVPYTCRHSVNDVVCSFTTQ